MSVRLLLSQNNGNHILFEFDQTMVVSRLIEGINKKIAEEGENHE